MGILRYAFLNAFATAIYICLVVLLIFNMGQAFGDVEEGENILIPISMLMLLVFSAALVGSLIFGRPAMWYVDGRKREALSLLAWTLGIFLGILVLVFLILVVVLIGF